MECAKRNQACLHATWLVSAVPSPQWLYEQIHALPDGDTTELHTKKSNIPEDKSHARHHKRKDGVKKLFNFLDSVIQESGSGESSGQEPVTMDTEKHSSSNGKQFSGTARSKQQDATSSSDNTQQKSEKTKGALIKEDQTSNTNKAGLTGYSQQVSNAFSPGLNSQNTQAVIQYVTANQQGGQRGIVTTPKRTAGYVANARSQSLACKWIFQQMKMQNHQGANFKQLVSAMCGTGQCWVLVLGFSTSCSASFWHLLVF